MADITNISKNFGIIKTAYNNLLSEAITSKNDANKGLFKKYVKSIKENEILKTQFLVYTNIENKVESDVEKARMFVKENIELFNKFDKNEILEANAKLAKDVLFEENPETNELYENITTLIFTAKHPLTVDKIVEATSNVVNYIINNKPKVVSESIDLPPSLVSRILIDKFNERYSTLDESERKMISVVIESTDVEKAEAYNMVLSECLGLINEQLNTSDLELKDKLLRVKEKLLNDKKEINEDFVKNLSKLVELRDNLK